MSINFWVLLALMCVLAIVILAWPLLHARQRQSIAYKDSNLGLYQHKLGELDQDLAEGRIDQEAYRRAREELDRELLADVPEDSVDNAALNFGSKMKGQPAMAVFIAAFLPAVSVLMYMQLGTYTGEQPGQVQAAPQQQQKQASVTEMVQLLEKRLETQGGDATAWAMLGRGYKHLKRYGKSASAFEKALAQEQNPSASLLLETAEAIAMSRGQKFDERSRELALSALDMEPGNITALWFAGVAEFQFGEHWSSVDHLARMIEIAPGEEVLTSSARHYLEQSRTILAQQGEDVSPIDEALQLIEQPAAATKPAATDAVRRIEVSIDVSDEIRQAFGAGTTVFVYARAQQGPKMPLAIQRLSLADLPAKVGLDDTMEMVPGMNIGAFDKLEVIARISPSGQAVPQSGDGIGSRKLDEVAAMNETDILIDAIVP